LRLAASRLAATVTCNANEQSTKNNDMKRQLSESEKQIVKKQQQQTDGSIRCFISGEIITESDSVEYDHIQPFAKEGETDIPNIRIVLKKYNRRKSDQSLYDVRDNLKLERLFESKKNNIKLQDIFELKEIEHVNSHSSISGNSIKIDDGNIVKEFQLLHDQILSVDYFYGRIPINWLENDDQEGLQPRVIDYKRLINIRDHLKQHPQLAPSIARLIDNKLKLFDGQHKLASQVMNGTTEIDIKVYISPSDQVKAKKLFDDLMITNLEAHSKLKQVPFYTSTLLDRLSVIYKELLEEFISNKAPENHTENAFINFLVVEKNYNRAEAKDILKSAIKNSALDNSPLSAYVAEASKDSNYPITIELLNKTIFPATLYLEPSVSKFTSETDFRNSEVENFKEISKIIVEESFLENWVPNAKSRNLTNQQLKARRIWHKGSVLTWAPYLKSVLYFALHAMTNDEREKILYRTEISEKEKQIIRTCLQRLFNHNFWDEPEGEIDSLLVSAKKQEDLFIRKGLSEKYVIYNS
jgi:hypothetical protein